MTKFHPIRQNGPLKDREFTIQHQGAIRHGDWKLFVGIHGNWLAAMIKKLCKDVAKDQFEACFNEGLVTFRFKPEARLEEFSTKESRRPKRSTETFNATFVGNRGW